MKVTDNKVQQFNYSKLRGRTVELGFRNKDVAEAINMSETTYSYKLNCRSEFTHGEISAICEFLSIPVGDIPLYFFATAVQKIELPEEVDPCHSQRQEEKPEN